MIPNYTNESDDGVLQQETGQTDPRFGHKLVAVFGPHHSEYERDDHPVQAYAGVATQGEQGKISKIRFLCLGSDSWPAVRPWRLALFIVCLQSSSKMSACYTVSQG